MVSALRVIAPELPYELRFIELSESREHISINGYEIDAFKVNHAVTCYGYAVNIPRIGKFDVEKAKALEIPAESMEPLAARQYSRTGRQGVYTGYGYGCTKKRSESKLIVRTADR